MAEDTKQRERRGFKAHAQDSIRALRSLLENLEEAYRRERESRRLCRWILCGGKVNESNGIPNVHGILRFPKDCFTGDAPWKD